jgi:hypothetical protein
MILVASSSSRSIEASRKRNPSRTVQNKLQESSRARCTNRNVCRTMSGVRISTNQIFAKKHMSVFVRLCKVANPAIMLNLSTRIFAYDVYILIPLRERLPSPKELKETARATSDERRGHSVPCPPAWWIFVCCHDWACCLRRSIEDQAIAAHSSHLFSTTTDLVCSIFRPDGVRTPQTTCHLQG